VRFAPGLPRGRKPGLSQNLLISGSEGGGSLFLPGTEEVTKPRKGTAMKKHDSSSSNLQALSSEERVSVQIPLPLLSVLADAESAFFDLCVQVGLQAFDILMEQDREAICGPKGQHNPDRTAVRSGSTSSEITLGGRRIGIRCLRARTSEGEVSLPSFTFASKRDPLDQ